MKVSSGYPIIDDLDERMVVLKQCLLGHFGQKDGFRAITTNVVKNNEIENPCQPPRGACGKQNICVVVYVDTTTEEGRWKTGIWERVPISRPTLSSM